MANITGAASMLAESGRGRPVIQNLGPDPMYWGDSNVSTSNGIKLDSGDLYEFPVAPDKDIWIVSAGTSDVRTQSVY